MHKRISRICLTPRRAIARSRTACRAPPIRCQWPCCEPPHNRPISAAPLRAPRSPCANIYISPNPKSHPMPSFHPSSPLSHPRILQSHVCIHRLPPQSTRRNRFRSHPRNSHCRHSFRPPPLSQPTFLSPASAACARPFLTRHATLTLRPRSTHLPPPFCSRRQIPSMSSTISRLTFCRILCQPYAPQSCFPFPLSLRTTIRIS